MAAIKRRKLGRAGPSVSAISLGCMGMSEFYGPADDAESLQTLQYALERGITLFDTADMYGRGHNERLIGQFLQRRREQVVLATKFGIVREGETRRIDTTPAYVRQACEASLQRLGIDVIDLYYAHRLNPTVPVEETVGAMAELVKDGKVLALGLSEVSAATLRRAHAVHPIAALQSEYSLWTRDPEASVLPVCRELGIAFVAYSPLGRGFLTGAIADPAALDPSDFRRANPRFQTDVLSQNQRIVDGVRRLALARGSTPAQLVLAWLLAQGEEVIPIPGTRRRKYLDENIAAVQIELTAAELAELDRLAPPGPPQASATRRTGCRRSTSET